MEDLELKDLKIKTERWLLFCSNNLKRASLLHAVYGIIISVVQLLLAYFLSDGLLHCDDTILLCIWGNQTFVYKVTLGIIFFFYSFILLYKTMKNDRDGVFTMIKIGCITLVVVDILYQLIWIIVRGMMATRTDYYDKTDFWAIFWMIVGAIIILFSIMVTFAIIRGNSKIVTGYYFTRLFLFFLSEVPMIVTILERMSELEICLNLSAVCSMFYHVMFFVLQVNVINQDNTSREQSQERMEDVELKDLKIEKGRWLLFCSNNLKTASVLHALQGIIISVIFFLVIYLKREIEMELSYLI